MTSVAEQSGTRTGAPPPAPGAARRASAWARRAPLLPALIFMIIVTQLPFLATLVISFMDWNAYYPDERGFAGVDNFVRVFTDVNMRDAVWTTILLTAGVVLLSLILGLGIANLPYTIYTIFYNAHDYGRASAAAVIVVIGTIIIATFALRTVSSLFREESGR